jgi:hypothetical protein
MGTYDADQLRELLGLWQRDQGVLSSDQMQALVEWEETPEDVRARLTDEITALGAGIKAAPVTPAQEVYPRKRDDSRPPQRAGQTLLDRLRSLFGRR